MIYGRTRVRSRISSPWLLSLPCPSLPHTHSILDFGGQRYQRTKWDLAFDQQVEVVVFVASLMSYSLTVEDSEQNELVDTLSLFHRIVNHEALANAPLVLVLNKKETFEKEVDKMPLDMVFQDFSGNTSRWSLFSGDHIRTYMDDDDRCPGRCGILA